MIQLFNSLWNDQQIQLPHLLFVTTLPAFVYPGMFNVLFALKDRYWIYQTLCWLSSLYVQIKSFYQIWETFSLFIVYYWLFIISSNILSALLYSLPLYLPLYVWWYTYRCLKHTDSFHSSFSDFFVVSQTAQFQMT